MAYVCRDVTHYFRTKIRSYAITYKLTERTEYMAHITEVVGKSSEMIARLALMANGWIVAKPDTDEPFDVVARDPANGRWYTFQVKTIRVREDRGGEYVVYAKRARGVPHTKSDADFIIGVMGAEGDELPRVYMFENRGLGEYWASESRAEKRWVRLPIELQRGYYDGGSVDNGGADVLCPAA